jgi:aspartate/methionine/tyrosine aminotransferase
VLARLATPRTKLLVVNSPNNPTGTVYPAATMAWMVDFAQRHNLWLISDECYDEIVLDGSMTGAAALAADDPRIASVYTFSKAYAMTGWRLGYVAGSAELIDTVTKVLESNSSCVSTISQVAAEAALDGPQDCVPEMVGAYRRRRDLVVDILREADMLTGVPSGAFYCMADTSSTRMSSRDLAFRFLRERGVSVAPGTAFGDIAPGRGEDQPGQLRPAPARGRRPAG